MQDIRCDLSIGSAKAVHIDFEWRRNSPRKDGQNPRGAVLILLQLKAFGQICDRGETSVAHRRAIKEPLRVRPAAVENNEQKAFTPEACVASAGAVLKSGAEGTWLCARLRTVWPYLARDDRELRGAGAPSSRELQQVRAPWHDGIFRDLAPAMANPTSPSIPKRQLVITQ